MMLIVGKMYRIKGYGYPLTLDAILTINGEHMFRFRAGMMLVNCRQDQVIGPA